MLRVGLTGSSSAIGQLTAQCLSQNGIEVITFSSKPSSISRQFCLGKEDSLEQFADLDAVIHLAWDWSENTRESWNTNVRGSIELIEFCKEKKISFIFLSTFSVFASANSVYGRQKEEIEKVVLECGGTVLRSGIIWGANINSGIIKTLRNIARKTFGFISVSPDPFMFHTEIVWLSKQLANFENLGRKQVLLASYKNPIKLSVLMGSFTRNRKKQIRLPINKLIHFVEILSLYGIRFPFRVDSLRAISNDISQQITDFEFEFLPYAPGNTDYEIWAQSS